MKIGEALVEHGLITPDQLKLALEAQEKTSERLGDITLKMGFVTPEKLAPFLADHFNLPFINIKEIYKDIKSEVVMIVPEELSHRFTVMPVDLEDNVLTLAMFDPLDVIAIDTLKIKTGRRIKRVVAVEKDIIEAHEYCYHHIPMMQELVNDFIELESHEKIEDDSDKLRNEASDPPVVQYVNSLVIQATRSGSSDIHLKPKQDKVELKFRIDGCLYSMEAPPKTMFAAIVTRIKILSGLDIAERRLPQDGRFKIKLDIGDADIRVSCFPTIYGESVVMRILQTSSPLLGLDKLGFNGEDLKSYRRIIRYSYGLILVTGPTGSGKTTTLYNSLNEIKSSEKNIITLEDPVEYRLPFIQQTQVKPLIGFDFASGLRSILRQDPDVIMVGEIRDKETAEIAIHAALTGHLVFSTLHTNDAAGAVVRLVDMGIEPFLITSSLLGVVAQRLIRNICPYCRKEDNVSRELLEKLDLKDSDIKYFKGSGCPKCMSSGYRGRISIFELLISDNSVKESILKKSSSEEISRHARLKGMKTLHESGIEKLKEGVTTVEEILRVTRNTFEE